MIDKLDEAFLWAIEQPEIKEFAEKQALNLVGYYGEEADKFLSFSEAGYAWALYNSGLAEKSPEEFGIPKLADWVLEINILKITEKRFIRTSSLLYKIISFR